ASRRAIPVSSLILASKCSTFLLRTSSTSRNCCIASCGVCAEIDERELEEELAQLEQEALRDDLRRVELPSVPAHPIPTYSQPASVPSNKAKNDQLAELERWAS
ncbi:unnamed protein product, partial [Rotaria sp. Silwood2]